MYTKDNESYFIVDSHVHFWDATPANQANRYGEGFINCFYDYHRNLSPGGPGVAAGEVPEARRGSR